MKRTLLLLTVALVAPAVCSSAMAPRPRTDAQVMALAIQAAKAPVLRRSMERAAGARIGPRASSG